MTLFPDAQKRAQAELDAVVGSGRLPTFADRPNLPIVESVYLESMRWHSIGPLGKCPTCPPRVFAQSSPAGLPHRLSQDDVYEGYLIPKDSIIIANIGYASFASSDDLHLTARTVKCCTIRRSIPILRSSIRRDLLWRTVHRLHAIRATLSSALVDGKPPVDLHTSHAHAGHDASYSSASARVSI